MVFEKHFTVEGFTEVIDKTREVRNSQVKKSSHETELRKIPSHFELLTQNFFIETFLLSY